LLFPSSSSPFGMLGGRENGKLSTSLDFETDLGLLSKYGYASSSSTASSHHGTLLQNGEGGSSFGASSSSLIRGEGNSFSWEVPRDEAELIAFVTNLPTLEGEGEGEGDITDEYGVCSIINTIEHSNNNNSDAQLQHAFDEDLLEEDEEEGEEEGEVLSGFPSLHQPSSATTTTPHLALPLNPLLALKTNNNNNNALATSLPSFLDNRATMLPPTLGHFSLARSEENVGDVSQNRKKNGSNSNNTNSKQSVKGQPKVRMSLAEFLTVTGGEEVSFLYLPPPLLHCPSLLFLFLFLTS
jgi:hypothetical protein